MCLMSSIPSGKNIRLWHEEGNVMIYKEEAIDAIEVYRRNMEHILGENNEVVKAIKTCEMLVEEVEDHDQN